MSSYDQAVSLFSSVKIYANESFALAKQYIDDLHSYVVATVSMTPPAINVDPTTSVTIDTSLEAAIPVAPSSGDYPSVPTEPSLGDYPMPTKPTYTLPTAPTITDITIPSFVDGTVLSITQSIPSLDFVVPTIGDISTTDVSQDSLLQAAKAKLESNILDGGTMLDSTVEADIWQRGVERDEQALQDALDKVTAQWAKLGFSLPDGLLAGQYLAIQNEYTNRRIDRSREISVKQAELEQAGMFKSLELAIGLEKIIVDSANEYAKRVLEASKATADVTMAIVKTRIDRYNSMLEAYKADVLAYKTSIEAEMVRAEAYKARIAGLQAIAQVDEARVKVYAANIAAIEQMANIYNTEVKAVATQYEAERVKVERFKAQIEAYIGKVEAVTKKYLAEVEGYKGYVQAWAASADSQTKYAELDVRAQIAEAEATVREWEIQMKLVQEETTLRLEALKAVAQTASNVAAGALSAAHASASMNFNEASSTSVNHNYTY